MDALQKDKAAGGSAPTASECNSSENDNTPTARKPQRGGAPTVATYLGTALRHGREAISLNHRHGPSSRVRREIDRACEAFDSARWLCDYAEGDR